MIANPTSASRLGTKLEIHHDLATSQSITENVACAQVAKKPDYKSGYVIAQPMLLALGIRLQPWVFCL